MTSVVRARTLQGFAELVTDLGANPVKILRRAGLDQGVLKCSDDWISFPSVVIAYELAALETKCPDFGVQLSERRDLSILGPLVLIFKYSNDLEAGLSSCLKYISTHNTGYNSVLHLGSDTVSWQLSVDEKLRSHANQWMEESLLTATKLLRIFLGADYTPQSVHFSHGENMSTNYKAKFGPEIYFNAASDAVVFNRQDLNSPSPADDSELHKFLLDYLDSRVLLDRENISEVVRSLLIKLIPTGKFSIDIIADQLCIHERTLQRRLKNRGLTFASLLDQCRAQMASDMLSAGGLPLVNLAYMLGYSDQSAFNHAFKRWYGTTPKKWRVKSLN